VAVPLTVTSGVPLELLESSPQPATSANATTLTESASLADETERTAAFCPKRATARVGLN
jgi:hypothetical protein